MDNSQSLFTGRTHGFGLAPGREVVEGSDELLAQFVAKSIKSLSIVEEDLDFRALIDYCNPMFQIPSRAAFVSTYLQELYDRVILQLLQEFGKVDHLALTSDLWTSKN